MSDQIQNQHTEAPAVAWTNLYTRTGGKLNITIRSVSGREALDELVEVVKYAMETYQFTIVPYTSAPTTPPPDRLPELPRPELETDVPETDYDGLVQFARLIISPQPDDRVNLEFFEEGHKYPDVKVNRWKTAQAEGLLKHLGTFDCTRPYDGAEAGIVFYKNGKEYQPGKHYKDVTHVRPA